MAKQKQKAVDHAQILLVLSTVGVLGGAVLALASMAWHDKEVDDIK